MPRLIKPLAPADPQAPISKTPPSDLGGEGRRLWRTIASLPWVGRSDSAALHNLCRQADLASTLREEIAIHGAVYEARGRRWANPAVAALDAAERALRDGLNAFGATPASRGKLGVSEPRPPSKMELLEARRRDRQRERDRLSPPAG